MLCFWASYHPLRMGDNLEMCPDIDAGFAQEKKLDSLCYWEF